MQYEIKYMLDQSSSYSVARLEDSEGSISETLFTIDKKTCYPIKMKGVSYSPDLPGQKLFINQNYYDIDFNLNIDEQVYFETSTESIGGFEIIEMHPF